MQIPSEYVSTAEDVADQVRSDLAYNYPIEPVIAEWNQNIEVYFGIDCHVTELIPSWRSLFNEFMNITT